jgi:hypothetical protein
VDADGSGREARGALGCLARRQVTAREVDHADRSVGREIGPRRHRNGPDAVVGERGGRLEGPGSVIGGNEQLHLRILADRASSLGSGT